VADTVAPAVDHLRFGFPSYYTSSRLALEGGWRPDVYDNAWFTDQTLALTDGAIAEIYRPNTPMMSLLAAPVAGLDILTARRTWLVVDLVLIGVTLAALFTALPALRSPPRALAVVGLCLWWGPLRETVGLGQAYALMLALQAVALWAVIRGRQGTAGFVVGIAVATKLAAVPVLLVLVVRGSVRALVVAAGTGLVLAAMTLGFAGVDSWARFLAVLEDDTLRPPLSLAVTAYQSATGLSLHLFAPDPTWNPGAVANAPVLASVVSVVAVVAALGVTLWLGRRGSPDIAVGMAIAAGVLVLNLAQEYHFAMLLVPAAVALARLFDDRPRRGLDVVWLLAALLLLGAPLPYEDPALSAGWLALLAYPRLYGAWLLWAWLVRAGWREREAGATPHVTHVAATAR
jgi:hypothetical protein